MAYAQQKKPSIATAECPPKVAAPLATPHLSLPHFLAAVRQTIANTSLKEDRIHLQHHSLSDV